MEDKNLILDLPFDEADGSTTAYDYSKSKTNATVHDCQYVQGKQGKAIEFDGNGYAEIPGGNIDLTGDITVSMWVKVADKQIGLCLQYDTDADSQLQRAITTTPNTWHQLVIAKEGLSVKVYRDAVLIDTITLPAQLVGMGVVQDNHATDNGVGCIDAVRIYTTTATGEDVEAMNNAAAMLEYSINGKEFKSTWGIYVEASDGLLDRPAMKTPLSQDWADYHGEVVDLTRRRVQSRDIALKCWMPCVGKNDFVNKWNDFCSQFENDGTVRFMVNIHPTKPLVYEVYLKESLSVSKRWNDKLFVATFTLKMREPDPVKRVVRFRVDEAGEQHTIKINAPSLVSVAWGDGTFTHNVYGDHTTDAKALRHTYIEAGVYYAIVGGVIEEIEALEADGVKAFETDGIVVWNKL